MPVEIKELVIRAVVEPPSGRGAQPSEVDTSDSREQEIVQICVREVLRILRMAEER